ncbi:patatin-like phospholipase family protein [Chryseolinea lacunae]|uniref:Patatin-like phospholipase family protein n=1 Tax=Chryseolinea lacunae TaxID=2801331 RepID=A0ABS1KVP1_9BACT|nr:patatin-like phospholipase family protein [Chryseolinea lacunae]MBL0743434.1 patatin-like phospholipase family protein [Chryseolinea lacunae]
MLKFFERNKFLILSGALVFFLVVLCWITSYNDKLVTTDAPLKIVSLQWTWNAEKAHAIVQSWKEKDVIAIALHSISIDYLFIVAYTLLLMCCVLARNRVPKPAPLQNSAGRSADASTESPHQPEFYLTTATKFFITLCMVAAGCDAIENVFTTRFILTENVNPVFFALPALIKYVSLGLVAIHLVLFIRFQWDALRELLKALRTYVTGIFFVLVSYFLFIRVSPGQDVVIQIAEWWGPFLWTMFSVIAWTIISWYSSRVVGYQKFENLNEPNRIAESLHMHIPRIIAFNALVSIQAAILALPTIGKLDQCQLWIFVIIQNLFYFVWHNLFNNERRVLHGTITVLVVLVYAVAAFWLRCDNSRHQRWLPLIALLLFIFELALLWLFIRRRAKLNSNAGSTSFVEITVASKSFRTPVRLPAEERTFFKWFNLFALVGIVVYVTGFFSFWLDNRMGPLAVALLAFGILVGLLNVISMLTIYKRVNFFVLLLVVALIVGNLYNPYEVRLHDLVENKEHHVERPDLKTYFHLWLAARKTLLDSTVLAKDDTFSVYVVIADGGASRSGYWVSSVLSALQDRSMKNVSGHTFDRHVLALSGASGGSVGTATFYSMLKTNPKGQTYLEKSRTFLKEDFLSPVITHLLGSDIIQHIVPLRWLGIGDRAQALEEVMEYFSQKSLDSTFEKPFTRVIDTTGQLPMLFINTTHVQQGAPAVVSSIKLKGFSHRVDVLDSVGKTHDLLFSTAVVLGARFPYISPAGSIDENYFVDGGYFDNTGAGVVHEMLQQLDSLYRGGGLDKNDSMLYSRLSFKLIHLSNSALESSGSSGIHPVINDAAAPLLTVLGTYSSQTDVNNQRLSSFLKKLDPKTPDLNINLYIKQDTIYPINWVISDYNLTRMNRRLKNAITQKECTEILSSLVPK